MCRTTDRPADVMARFLERLSYVAADAAQDAGWDDLAEALKPDGATASASSISPSGPTCSDRSASGWAATGW